MEKQLVIKPRLRNKFSGLSSYSRTKTPIEGAQLNKFGWYNTGLTEDEERKYEKLLGLKQGELSKKSPFWGTVLKITLNNDKPTFIGLSGELDELKYKVILEHEKIANNYMELQKNPNAEFYIDDPESIAAMEASKIDLEMEAMEAMFKTTIEEKRGLLRLYGKKETQKMTESMVKATLAKLIKENPEEFIHKTKDKALKTKMLIEELLEVGLFKKKGNYYYNGEDLIGTSTEEIVGYLTDMKNQSVKLNLENKLKKYREGK